MNRRELIRSSAALAFAVMQPASAMAQTPANNNPMHINERIEIHANGTVRVIVGHIEMGQGFNSAVAQLVAEELDVDIARIVIAPVDTASSPNEGFTDASASMSGSAMAFRQAAAQARVTLLTMAARSWRSDATGVQVRDGAISNGVQSMTYWDLVAQSDGRLPEIGQSPIKSPESYRVLGRDTPRLDLPAKVTGGAAFVHDLRLPGMLHARVLRPPMHGSRLASIDADDVERLPGVVQVVRNGSFLAVVADREEQAIAALSRLRAVANWTEGDSMPAQDTLYDDFRRRGGLQRQDDQSSARSVAATYEAPYRMHGSIGPSCAVAHYQGETLTVWSHAQGMFPLRSALSELLGLPSDRIRCIHMEGSGCYGHNGADDAAADAALIAMEVSGRPVRLQWMRDDEHRWEPYGPAMVMQLRGAVDAEGRVSSWRHRGISPTHSARPSGATQLLAGRYIDPPLASSLTDTMSSWAGGGRYNAEPYYDFAADVDVDFVDDPPLRSSALRGLGSFANIFAIECFMDELAATANADPVQFRLDHLADDRARAVIVEAAERFGWSGFESTQGRRKGFAFARLNNHGAFVAVAAEVRSADGRVWVSRAAASVDCGEAISPVGVRNQIEGGIVQAASWALLEEVRFDQDGIASQDWESYPIMRITEAPEVEVSLLDRPGSPYLGVGEAAQGPAGAAVANAAAAALGERIRTLPIVKGS